MFEDDYDIPLDDFDVPYVTIEEMQELYPNAKLCMDEESGLYYTTYFDTFERDLILTHLYVELLMNEPEKVDWAKITRGYQKSSIEYLEHIYTHPLVWIDQLPDDFPKGIAVVGKIAQEMSSYERDCCSPYDMFFFNMFHKDRILWFVDNLPTGKDYGYFNIYHADFILWNYLTEGIGIYGLHEDEKPIVFNVDEFQRNINFIADHRGGAKAAELVRLFRKDWPDIVAMKLFLIDYMSDEQIEDFRQALFEGMERSLRKWENQDEQKEVSSVGQTAPCLLFTKKAKLENKTDEIAEALRNSLGSRSDKARAVVDEVHFWQKQGYIDAFYNARVMYDELAKIMTLPFKYSGFRKYYNE